MDDTWLPQLTQARPSGAAHSSQIFASSVFSCWHFGHFIARPWEAASRMLQQVNVARDRQQGRMFPFPVAASGAQVAGNANHPRASARSKAHLKSGPTPTASSTSSYGAHPGPRVFLAGDESRADDRWALKGRFWHKGEAEGGAKPVRLCPCSSDVDLFGYGESVIDLNAEIPDGALDLGMSQQQLHGT